jgi:hypothetical protein
VATDRAVGRGGSRRDPADERAGRDADGQVDRPKRRSARTIDVQFDMLAVGHGSPWGALVTAELIRRHEQELAWLAELGELAQEEP